MKMLGGGVLAAEMPGPDWAVQLTAFATLATAVILLITALVAATQVDDARKTRHAQLIVNLSRRWDEITTSEELYTKYSRDKLVELVSKIYASGATEQERKVFVALIELPTLIETIGVLEREENLALRIIDELWGLPIRHTWAAWESAVARLREVSSAPSAYENFERLAQRLEAYRRELTSPWRGDTSVVMRAE
jgi:hypothetical protein